MGGKMCTLPSMTTAHLTAQWLKVAHMKEERTPEIIAFDQYMAAMKRYEEEKKEAEKKRRAALFHEAVFNAPLAPIKLNVSVKRVGDTVIMCQSPRECVIQCSSPRDEMDAIAVRVAESVLEK